ncbi:MAG TPA: NAD(P)-binding protein [Solirubrobacteraceae bacterium]|nr:NAD(P)-binding protein [Solirubrobacteraceae bacterium]
MLGDTDYLVVGGGASGLAFADALVAAADVEVTVVDRRAAPGGHWPDAYPFVRLHTPSAYYGVNSRALGEDRVDQEGENAGFYERASGGDVCRYFAEVALALAATGRVNVLTGHEHLGSGGDGELIRDLSTGEVHELVVRRKIVDARYLEASIPATHVRPFDVASGARVIPVNDLPAAAGTADSYAVLGSGKTAADACVWLLDEGVEPDRIRWIRPREAWFYDRRHFQPLEQVGALMEGIALDAEAAAQATSIEDLFERLESWGRFARVDPSQPARMYRGTMLSARELEALRQIDDAVRLGRVRRVEPDRIVLERGETDTSRAVLHVDCTALGLRDAPATPIFQQGRIVIQQVRHLSPCFNAALIAFVEAHRDEDEERNALCPSNPYAASIDDWPRMMSRTWRTEGQWLSAPDVSAWVADSRLNLLRAVPEHAAEPSVQTAVTRYLAHVADAIERLAELDSQGAAEASVKSLK